MRANMLFSPFFAFRNSSTRASSISPIQIPVFLAFDSPAVTSGWSGQNIKCNVIVHFFLDGNINVKPVHVLNAF